MAAGGKGIIFKVTDTQSGRQSLFKSEQYSTFEERCKERFEYAPDSDVVFVLEEDDDAEIDEPVFECLETMTKLKMKPKHGKEPFEYSLGSDELLQLEDDAVELDENALDCLDDKTKLKIKQKHGKEPFEYSLGSDELLQLEDDAVELDENALDCLDDKTKLKIKQKHGKEPFEYSLGSDELLQLEDDAVELDENALDCLDDKTKLKIKQKHGKEPFEYSLGSDELLQLEDDAVELDENALDCLDDKTKLKIKQKHGADYIKEQLKKRGKDKLKFIIEEADKMEVQPLAIGVIGTSGQGKSTLINTLRDLLDSDEDGTPVGETETTTECRANRHPVYPKLVFWDIPGEGTKHFPRKGYISDIKFDKYDFYLICSCSRLTNYDLWLIEEIKKGEKECYFLRTKVDQDIDNAKRRNKNISKTLDKIRKSCHVCLGQERKVFLLDCREKYQYDFPEFLKTLCADATQEQKRSLTRGLVSVYVEMIEEKAMYLKSEIWKTASLSAFGGVVIPEFSFGLDSALIYRKLEEYQRQFELTDAHIKEYAELIGLPETEFRRTAELKINFDFIRKQGINYLIKFVAGGVITKDADPFVLFVGIGIVMGMSFRTTGKILEKILDDCRHDAIAIFKLVNARQTNN